jgi:cytochrome c biogenesis protein CcmG, thiol:disulfide interchange protein DsbE
MNRWYVVFLLVLIGGSGWLWASRPPLEVQALTGVDPAVGLTAPDFELATLDGGTVQLSDLRGTPVVLNFWATWCGPCRRELPSLQTAAESYAGRVVILGIDQGEAPEVVQTYVDELGLTFPIPMDTDMAVGARYNVRGLPTTYFVDAQGVIRHVWLGEMNSITLAEGIAKVWR